MHAARTVGRMGGRPAGLDDGEPMVLTPDGKPTDLRINGGGFFSADSRLAVPGS